VQILEPFHTGKTGDRVRVRTIEITIPDTVFQQAQELAKAEGMAVERLLGVAVAQAIGSWADQQQTAAATKASRRRQFLEMLQTALESGDKPVRMLPATPAPPNRDERS
jgi:hypothetical protein